VSTVKPRLYYENWLILFKKNVNYITLNTTEYIKMKKLILKINLCVCFSLAQFTHAAQLTPFADENRNLWLRMEGTLENGDAQSFNNYIEEAKAQNLEFYGVTLISSGGLLQEGKAIAKLVRDNRMITYVPDNSLCASSCFWVFAGIHRYAGKQTSIGVHSVGRTNQEEDELTKSNTLDMIRAYAALGVPDDIVGATAKTKPNEIHFLTRSELNAMVNNPAPPEEFTNYLISTNQSVETTKLIQTSLPSEESKNYSRDLNERGINLIHTGNYDEAVKVLEEAKKHNNFDTEVLGNLGYAYYRNNDLKNAQDNITASLKINETRSVSWGNLGEIVAKQGNVKWAIDCFNNYIYYSKNKESALRHLNRLTQSENIYLSMAASSIINK